VEAMSWERRWACGDEVDASPDEEIFSARLE
jgi:hypothetical protein